MSGEPVLLVAEVDSVPYRSVGRLAEVTPRLPDFALIGGIAVMVRLGQAHRATNDVDTVSDDQPGLLDVLVTEGFERIGDSVMLDSDLKVDVIDVSEGDADYLPYLTHRLAFDTRTPIELVVRPHQGPSISAYVDVARPAALVAVKLGISEGVGRQRDPRKVGSDAFDVVRLMQRLGPDALADELRSVADPDFVARIAELAHRHLVVQVDRTVAAITRSSVQGVVRIDAAQLELLGESFVRRLATQRNGR
ncbi:MAG: hypothetical protein ACRDZR_03510 [Acidimicrobiales bacterium]